MAFMNDIHSRGGSSIGRDRTDVAAGGQAEPVMNARPTLHDVARDSGVSKSTVARHQQPPPCHP